MKLNKILLKSVILLASYMVYFVWMPFPKGIINSIGSSTFVYDVITNLIWFFGIAIISLLFVNNTFGSKVILKRKYYLGSIGISVCCQLLFDVLNLILKGFLKEYTIILTDFLSAIFWIIVVILICNLLQLNCFNKKLFFGVCIPILLILFIIASILNMADIEEMKLVEEKYTSISSELTDIATNTVFFYTIRSAIFDYLCGFSAFLALSLSTENKSTHDSQSKQKRRVILSLRLVTALVLAFAICGIKMLIIPHSALKTTGISSNTSKGAGFYENSTVTQWSRATGYSQNDDTVFSNTDIKLYYDGELILSYNIDGKYHSTSIHLEGNQIIMDDKLEKFDIDETEIVVSFDRAVAYMKNGVPYAVELKKLKSEPKDDELLKICKLLLENSKFECFEYVSDYVNQYNPDFTRPYFERYAKGEFSEEEIEKNPNINLEYIIRIAKGYLE